MKEGLISGHVAGHHVIDRARVSNLGKQASTVALEHDVRQAQILNRCTRNMCVGRLGRGVM